MPYSTATGQLTRSSSLTLQASVVRTATANGAAVELGDKANLRLDLAVTAASGTSPSMTVKIQDSPDGSSWTDVSGGAFTAATTTTTQHLKVGPVDRFVRHVATITGTTPSFTYSVSGEAV